MSQTIDPNVLAYQRAYENDPLPPDLKDLQTQLAAAIQQSANTPASHPTFASLQTRKTVLQTAIAQHPKNGR